MGGWIVFVVTGMVLAQPAGAAGLRSGASSTAPFTGLEDSFARCVPEDVGAFVEIRGLAHLAAKLWTGGGLAEWTQLAAGQTSRPAVTVEWGQRVNRILGMELAEAARNLFGQQAALAAPSYDELAEGVVIARAPDDEFISQLLTENKARSQEPVGGVSCYLLREGLSLAVKDTVVVLGARAAKAGLFDRTVNLLAGRPAPTLFASPRFARQVRRLPSGGQGVIYLDLPAPAADETASDNRPSRQQPAAQSIWSSFRNMGIGLFDRPGGIDLEVRGLSDRPVVRGGLKDVSLDPIGRLPASTLAVWARTLDLAAMYRQTMAGRDPDQRTLRFNIEVVRALMQPVDLEKEFLEKLGPQVMLIIGTQPANERRTGGGYDLPLVALMVESRDSRATSELLLRLSERFLGWMKVQLTRAKRSLELNVIDVDYRRTVIHRIPLGELFAKSSACPYLSTTELCWAGLDDWLIVASHPDHIRQIIDARQADIPETFAGTSAFGAIGPRTDISTLVLIRPADAARLLQSWLDYCSKHAPHVFEPLWWKRMMIRRGGRRVALGIIIKQGAEPGRVVVGNPVLPEMPAAGRLMPGDKICAVDGRTLSEDRPEDDLRDFVAMRTGSGVVLRVERAGKLLDIRIPMAAPAPLPVAADIDPVRSIQHLIKLGRGLSVGGYVGAHGQANQFNATLILRMNQTPSE